MERSEHVGELISALAKAQAEFTFAAKDSSNPAFNSKYADLAANIAAVRPSLSKHGIALMQFDEADVQRQTASVTTALHHGEQWISVTVEAPATGRSGFNVQSLGACWTYLRRYTLQAICGLASDDDDGNSLASDPKQAQVFAEVERQKAVVERQKSQRHPIGHDEAVPEAATLGDHLEPNAPPELDWSYQKTTGVLLCRLVSVNSRKKKDGKGEYLTIQVNGQVGGKKPDLLTYFHESARDLLLASTGKIAKLETKVDGDFANVLAVLEVDGRKVEKPAESDETKARLLASTLDFEEDDLRELHGRYCNGNWSEVLVKLEELRERRASEAAGETMEATQ